MASKPSIPPRPGSVGSGATTEDRSRFVVMRLESVRRAFPSDAAVARALGVSPSQPARWRQGQEPDAENIDKLAGLDIVIEMLTGYLHPRSIPKWLNGPNAHLGDRSPIALLRQGELPAVISAIRASKSGAYA